jgi:hypothetical protein
VMLMPLVRRYPRLFWPILVAAAALLVAGLALLTS